VRIFSLFAWRRPLRALERIAAAAEEHNRILRAHWGIREKPSHSPRSPRPIEFGTFDVEAANKEWRERQAEIGLSDEDAI
jgi:hypothetical protein